MKNNYIIYARVIKLPCNHSANPGVGAGIPLKLPCKLEWVGGALCILASDQRCKMFPEGFEDPRTLVSGSRHWLAEWPSTKSAE